MMRYPMLERARSCICAICRAKPFSAVGRGHYFAIFGRAFSVSFAASEGGIGKSSIGFLASPGQAKAIARTVCE